MDFPVLIVDLNGAIKRANEAAERILGIGADQVIGRNFAELSDNEPWKNGR